MRRWLLRIALLLLVLLALAAAGTWLALRGSLAQLDGEVSLPGLSQPVTLERDALGSASIQAQSAADAWRALGHVHAQERYFEMDLMRRSAAGELAALFGPLALPADRAVRVHRLRVHARRIVAAEPPHRRALLHAYAQGANAGLRGLSTRPWPYLLLRMQPQPWTEEDSALVALAMFLDLHDASNRRELGLLQLVRHLDPRVAALLRTDGSEWDAPLFGAPRGALQWRGVDATNGGSAAPAPAGNGVQPEDVAGSNNFAVSGALTDDGRALVADDMHLGLRVPALWFRARVQYRDEAAAGGLVDMTGLSLPGVPGIIAGSNRHVAWGFTNSYGDWLDWVEVPWEDATQLRYRTPAGVEAATLHEESIEVAGAEPELLRVVHTRWGPVLHGIAAPAGPDDAPGATARSAATHAGADSNSDSSASAGTLAPSLALAWTATRPGGADFGLLELAIAADIDAAIAIAQRSGMPAQNLVVGDSGGRIGWTLAGRIPRRSGGCDPQLALQPLRGCDWNGWVAPAQAPVLADPRNQRLWTANARVLDGAWLALVGDGGYDLGARQQQVRDGLFARERFDEQALLDIQLDDRAVFMQRWWRLLRDTVEDAAHAGDSDLQQLAAASAVWNGRAAVDSASYRLARAFRLEVHGVLYDLLLQPVRAAEGAHFVAPRLPQFEAVAWALLEQRPAALPGSGAQDWNALLADAARAVVTGMRSHGEDLSLRTWGERNRAAIRHPLSGALPGPLAALLDMPDQPLPGDSNMPRVQAPGFGASQRFVVAPGQEERGLMHLPGGASGHPLSPFHGAGHRDWVEGKPTPFLPGPGRHRLRLVPPAGSAGAGAIPGS